MNMENPKLLSIVLLCYYSRHRIDMAYQKIKDLLDRNQIPFEMIVMDDGSTDDTYQIALELEKQHPNVRAYQLSRNYGSIYNVFAGLSLCKGACAMPIVDDEQQPYETIVEMYRLWEQGHKVIIPNRIDREDSKVSAFFSNSYYAFMNKFSRIKYPKGGCDLAFLDREVLDILNTRIHPRNTMYVAEVLNLGFSPYFLPYKRPLGLNEGKSSWTFSKKVRLFMDSFISTSTFPLRLISMLGVGIFLLSLIAFVFYLYIASFGDREFWGIEMPGWISIILVMLMFNGLILLSIGIVAEYIWRIFDEVKDRPGYIIKKKDTINQQ
jgi:dolichol-phosphate mannosyltransferase